MVVAKAAPACLYIRQACARFLRMLKLAEDPANSFSFSPAHVIDYCRFAERLHHFESGSWEFTQIGPDGTPDSHIILEPWQIWVECAVQGFRRRDRGDVRLVTTVLEVVPRKSAKSLKAAIAILYDLCHVKNAEIPIAAITEKAGKDTVFGDLIKMLGNEPELVDHYKLTWTTLEIRRGDGRVWCLTGQGERQDGLNPSLAVFEEGHAGAQTVWRVVDSAFGARPGSQRRMITTAGYSPEGPGYDLILDAQQVLGGNYEDFTLFAAIYTLDRDDYIDKNTHGIDWQRLLTREDLLWKANPMMGISLDVEIVLAAAAKAFRNRRDRREFARTRFNIWVGSGEALIEPTSWAACKRQISLEQFFREKCWIGVDLATYHDMCAVVLVFMVPTGELAVFADFWLPESSDTAANPEISDRIAEWSEGANAPLTLTRGTMADHDAVRERVQLYCEMFDVQMIACDPAQAHNTVYKLWGENRPVMVYPNKAATMTAPTDDLLGRISSQTIWHDGNPVLAWNAANVHGDRRGNGSIMPRKEKDESPRKIDGFAALCMADGCIIQPEWAKPAVEEEKRVVDALVARGGAIGYEEFGNGTGQR